MKAAPMVAMSGFSKFCCFTIHYFEPSCLPRILDVLTRAGAEPAWLFTRAQRGEFKLEAKIGDLSKATATLLASRMRAVVNVVSVDWKFETPPKNAARQIARRGKQKALSEARGSPNGSAK